MDTIIQTECTECKKVSWVNLGDVNDLTVSDPDGATCPYCGKAFLFEGVREILEMTCVNLADAYIIKAYKTANEAAENLS